MDLWNAALSRRAIRFVSACSAASAVSVVAAAAQPITFNEHVAPIVHAKCATCHQPGEIAPFSLLTYDDVRRRATQIADVTARRIMPPWKPRAAAGTFVGDRSLTDDELRTIQQWIASGAPEGTGTPIALPAPRRSGTWQLGTPDLVVTMDAPYVVPAEGPDVFRTFVLRMPTTTRQYVRGLEFHPGNPRVVHHVNIGVDRTRSSRHLDARDPEPGYSGGMAREASYPPGHMLGWTPGQQPRPSPEGLQWRLEPDSDLVLQLHLQPTGKPEPLQASVGLYFTAEPPRSEPVGLRLGSQTIDIAAGDAAFAIEDQYVLPVDADAIAIQPHAHNLARAVRATAQRPDGSTEILIDIDDWDFRWQDVYRYRVPVALPKGTRVQMRFNYDNSAANPRNPHRPPQRVVWGQNTSDEMGDLWLQLVPRRQADLQALNQDVARKRRDDDLAAYTKLVKEEPGNPLRHDAVAMLYLEAGQPDRAASHFRTSLQLNSQSAPTHYNLGLALSMQRRFDEARREFEAALALDPGHAEAENNLGAMFHLAGRVDEAAVHYSRAIALRPDNAEAVNNLGRIRLAQKRHAEAAGLFARAIAINPDLPTALAALAWVRATAPDAALRDPVEAVRLAQKVDDLTGHSDPSALDTLAAAYAAAGRFEEAIDSATKAIGLLPEASPLRPQVGGRRDLYRLRRAFIDN